MELLFIFKTNLFMVFNVILFHIGDGFDETLDSYNENKNIIYKKCYNSVKAEFKDDNITIFHSFEEVFNKFKRLRNLYNKYQTFLNLSIVKNAGCYYSLDLLRALLTLFIPNMVYIDSDIEVCPGLRNYLLEFNKSKNIMLISYYTTSFFFSKNPCKEYIKFIDKAFNDDYYFNDVDSLKKFYIKNDEVIIDPLINGYLHHFNSIVEFQKITDIYLIKKDKILTDDYLKSLNIKDNILLAFSNKIYNNGYVHYINSPGKITLEDLYIYIGEYNKFKIKEINYISDFLSIENIWKEIK